MDIVQAPNPVLSTPTQVVKSFDKRLSQLIADMQRTLAGQKNPEGVGLAANQVGVPLSIFIAKESPDAQLLVCINPKILKSTEDQVSPTSHDSESIKKKTRNQKLETRNRTKLEGCLSVKYIWGSVQRNPKILLEYQDITGKHQKKWFSGFIATIIQHEVDHIHGVLFTQRVLEQKGKLYKEEDGELEEYSI